MTNPEDKISAYTLGHSDIENRRLLIQARLFDPYTEAFLRKAGIREGMKILDVGSGMGDVSFLAAKLVGKDGQVIGIDADDGVTGIATDRALIQGMENVKFVTGDAASFDSEGDFDAVIGRLILIHIEDPAALLRQLTNRLRPGGLIAFEDAAFPGTVYPACPLIEYLNEICKKACDKIGIDLEFGYRLPAIFQEAGLGVPELDYFAPTGAGPDWPGYEWLVEAIRTLLPAIRQFDLASETEIDIDTLEARIRKEAIANQSTVTIQHHITAWTTAP